MNYDIKLPSGTIAHVTADSDEDAQRQGEILKAKDLGTTQGKAPGTGNYIDNIVRQLASGASFGSSDELSAAADAATHGVLGRGAEGQTFGERYGQNLEQTRAQDKAFAEENPKAAGAAKIVGNIAGAGAMLHRAMLSPATGIVQNILKGGLTGGTLAGVQGFNEGEGGLGSRATNAAMEALYGAIGGGAIPVAGAVAGKAAQLPGARWVGENIVSPAVGAVGDAISHVPLLNKAAPLLQRGADNLADPAEATAREQLALALQRGGGDVGDALERLGKLGDQGMIADINRPMLRETRRVVTNPEGESGALAEDMLTARNKGTSGRVLDAFTNGENVPSRYDLQGNNQAYDTYRRIVGASAYGEANDAGLTQSLELRQLMDNPEVSAAIDQVLKKNQAARAGTNMPPASQVDVMHQVKQQIQNLGQTETGRGAPWQQAYRDLAGNYVGALRDANPSLARADDLYGRAASRPEYFDMGYNFMGGPRGQAGLENSPAALADRLPNADPMLRQDAQWGATNAARETAEQGTAPAQAMARRIGGGPFSEGSTLIQQRMEQLYGPDRARQIAQQMENEGVFNNTRQQLLQGSKTGDVMAEQGFGNARLNLTHRGIHERVTEHLNDLAAKAFGPDEEARNALGKMMLNPNPEENRKALMLAAELMKRRAQGSPVNIGAAAGIGSEVGRQ